MNPYFLFLFSILFFLPRLSLAEPKSCRGKFETQAQMTQCACDQYRESDALLNDIYGKVVKKYKDQPAYLKIIKTAQKDWLKFRDSYIESRCPRGDNNPYGYGSMAPMEECDILSALTLSRTEQLKLHLDHTEEFGFCMAGSADGPAAQK